MIICICFIEIIKKLMIINTKQIFHNKVYKKSLQLAPNNGTRNQRPRDLRRRIYIFFFLEGISIYIFNILINTDT